MPRWARTRGPGGAEVAQGTVERPRGRTLVPPKRALSRAPCAVAQVPPRSTTRMVPLPRQAHEAGAPTNASCSRGTRRRADAFRKSCTPSDPAGSTEGKGPVLIREALLAAGMPYFQTELILRILAEGWESPILPRHREAPTKSPKTVGGVNPRLGPRPSLPPPSRAPGGPQEQSKSRGRGSGG